MRYITKGGWCWRAWAGGAGAGGTREKRGGDKVAGVDGRKEENVRAGAGGRGGDKVARVGRRVQD